MCANRNVYNKSLTIKLRSTFLKLLALFAVAPFLYAGEGACDAVQGRDRQPIRGVQEGWTRPDHPPWERSACTHARGSSAINPVLTCASVLMENTAIDAATVCILPSGHILPLTRELYWSPTTHLFKDMTSAGRQSLNTVLSVACRLTRDSVRGASGTTPEQHQTRRITAAAATLLQLPTHLPQELCEQACCSCCYWRVSAATVCLY